MPPTSAKPAACDFDVDAMSAPAAAVDRYLASFIDARPLPDNLREAVRYGLFNGGKRLRPILVVRCCEAVGGDTADAYAAAAAVELVHGFSLVHDDLPAMDDDDLRRGRPTLHRHTNEAMAILAGDAMLSLAFEIIAARIGDAPTASQILRELSVGTTDMVAGQVYDTLPTFAAADEPIERLRIVHRHKTAAPLRAACRMGAICGEASAEQLGALTRYAEAVGLMFQIVDDLLDVTATTEQLGKTAGKDAAQDKLTYPAVLGVESSRAEVERLHQQAIGTLEPLGDRVHRLRELCEYMAVRNK